MTLTLTEHTAPSSEPALSLAVIEARFVAWAESNDDIRAAFVVGSQARTDHPADAWSDLDIIMFANNVDRYQDNADWIASLAPVWIALRGQTVAGDPERLNLLEGGLQVDFVLHDAAVLRGFRQMVASGDIPDTVRRGVRVLVDKDDLLPNLPEAAAPLVSGPPDQATLRRWLDSFWFSAAYAARQLRRGELLAYQGAACGLRQQLLPLIEWHTHVTRGWDVDTWHNGRFLQEWADPRIYRELVQTYTTFDEVSSWRGLGVLLALVTWVSEETAAGLGFTMPMTTYLEIQRDIAALQPSWT